MTIGQSEEQPNAIPLASIEPVVLEGQPPCDKGFRVVESAVVYRVRVKLADEIAPAFTATGGVAPNLQAFDITVTRLDASGAVERDAAGRVIFAAHTRHTVDEETRARPGYSAADDVMLVVRKLIYDAELRRVADAETASYFATEWAVEPLAPTAPLPPPMGLSQAPEATAADFGID